MNDKLYVVYETIYDEYENNNVVILATGNKDLAGRFDGFQDHRVIEYIPNNASLDELILENNMLKVQLRNAMADRETFERNYIETYRKLHKLEKEKAGE